MRHTQRWVFVLAVIFGLTVEGVLGSLPSSVILLVVPARPRLVQLAFDMVHLRSVAVVAYHGEAKTTEPVLHVWSGSDWQYVSLQNFTDKQFIPGRVRKVIIVGEDSLVPAVLLRSMPWCSDIERLPTLNVADLVNSLDQTLKFREREWKWLTGRYGLTLTDLNAERRARNPYDTPRSKLPLEKREFKQEQGDMAPAQLIEKKTATPSVEKPPK